jgi:hypothetical protein
MQLLQHAGGLNVEGEADSWDFGVGMEKNWFWVNWFWLKIELKVKWFMFGYIHLKSELDKIFECKN